MIQPPSVGKIVAFPEVGGPIIGTNVARPEPQRSSIARSLRRDPSLSTHCVEPPISGSRSRSRLSILTITVTGFRERTNFRAWPIVAVADEHPL
jgi:hypothetical protein